MGGLFFKKICLVYHFSLFFQLREKKTFFSGLFFNKFIFFFQNFFHTPQQSVFFTKFGWFIKKKKFSFSPIWLFYHFVLSFFPNFFLIGKKREKYD